MIFIIHQTVVFLTPQSHTLELHFFVWFVFIKAFSNQSERMSWWQVTELDFPKQPVVVVGIAAQEPAGSRKMNR